MRYLSALAAAAVVTIAGATLPAQDAGWVSLFDGKSLDGWKVGENAASFSVADGAIVVNGPRAHLYYVGPVGNHDFKNFEFKADVMTTPGSNSGIYFHTAYQEGGWPSKGYEVQVNNSHTDPKRTAGLYAIVGQHGAAGQGRRMVHDADRRPGQARDDVGERQEDRRLHRA